MDWIFIGAVPSNTTNVNNDGDGLYPVSRILTVTRSEPGQLVATAAINGTLTQGTPAGMALLGLGMLGIGAIRRHRT